MVYTLRIINDTWDSRIINDTWDSEYIFLQDISQVYQVFSDEILGSGQFGVVYGGILLEYIGTILLRDVLSCSWNLLIALIERCWLNSCLYLN